jgi:hypothetical protein
MGTSIFEVHTASIFRAEYEGNMFLQCTDTYLPTTQCTDQLSLELVFRRCWVSVFARILTVLAEFFLWSSSVSSGKCCYNTSIRPWPLPSKLILFPIHQVIWQCTVKTVTMQYRLRLWTFTTLKMSDLIYWNKVVSCMWGCNCACSMDWCMALLTTYTHHLELQVITAPSLISTLYSSLKNPLSLSQPAVLTSRSLATAFNIGDCSASHAQVLLSQPLMQNTFQFLQSQLTTANHPLTIAPSLLSLCCWAQLNCQHSTDNSRTQLTLLITFWHKPRRKHHFHCCSPAPQPLHAYPLPLSSCLVIAQVLLT